ncbi:hypothetical protein JCM11491_002098 [Sporobolomyces phaffii]
MSATDYKNVVIVGLGLSGVHALETLSKALPSSHRILAISPIPGFWPVSALRSSVVPGYEKNSIAPLDHLLPAGSRHKILEGYSVDSLQDQSVTLDRAHPELGREIEFDYCVLATGSSYPFPCRPPPGSTEESIAELFKKLQAEIAESESVLILGAGPVGIELAGEISEYYDGSSTDKAKKRVTLVHSGSRYIEQEGFKPKFGDNLKGQLEKLGVELVFNEKVDVDGRETGKLGDGENDFKLSTGQTLKADFLFLAFGNSPNTKFLPPSYLDPTTHRVLVHPSFQTKSNPRVFAIGDISSVDEPKLYANAKNHHSVVSQNIVSLIQGRDVASLKEYKPGAAMMVVSVGSKGGAGQLFGWVLGPWLMSIAKSKALFVPQFKQLYAVA